MFILDFIANVSPIIIALWQTGYYSVFDPRAARDYLEASQIAKGRM